MNKKLNNLCLRRGVSSTPEKDTKFLDKLNILIHYHTAYIKIYHISQYIIKSSKYFHATLFKKP